MYAEERQQAMAQLISRRGRVSVAELAEEFAVTTETVRRDLSTLERMGLVRRVHGGAVPAGTLAVIESGIAERDLANTQAKDAIAAAAVALLPPPDSMIVIDAGTTTARFAAALPRDHRLTVVTHAVPVAARLAGLPQIELFLLPGKVRPTTHAAVGADTVAALADIRADVAFVATNGLTITHGLTTPDRDEAATKRAIIACAAAHGRARRLHQDRRRDRGAVRRPSTASTCWSPTAASPTTTAAPCEPPDVEVVIA